MCPRSKRNTFEGWGKNDEKKLVECYMAVPKKVVPRILCLFFNTVLSQEH